LLLLIIPMRVGTATYVHTVQVFDASETNDSPKELQNKIIPFLARQGLVIVGKLDFLEDLCIFGGATAWPPKPNKSRGALRQKFAALKSQSCHAGR
jgi:hypothetical protein